MIIQTISTANQPESSVQNPYQTPKLEVHGVYNQTTGISFPIGAIQNPFGDLSLIPDGVGLNPQELGL